MIAEYIKMEWDTKVGFSADVGGLDLQAKTTVIPYKSVVIARNQEIGQITGRLNKDSYDLTVNFANSENYVVKFWEQNTNFGTIESVASMVGQMIKEKSADALYETMLPKIFDATGNQVGEVQYIPVDQGGLQSYSYNKLILNGVELSCYQVCHDKEIDMCIYDSNNQMVAMISKRMPVINGKSRYTMYMISDEWAKYVILLCTIMHHMNYDENDFKKIGIQSDKLNNFQNGLKEKYDPNFKNNIIAQEGTNNLPDNMPLVQERVKDSQNTFMIKFKKIISIIFIVGFIALFVYLFCFASK